MGDTPPAHARSPIAAVLTPPGRAAVAVIQVCGAGDAFGFIDSLFHAANGRTWDQQEAGRGVYGSWGNEPAEDVVLCRIDESTTEIHCHGGRAAPQRILSDLESVGATIVPAEQLLADTAGELAAELQSVLSRTKTVRTADYALAQCRGAFEAGLRRVCELDDERQAAAEIDAILQYADFGRHLTKPWRVVVCGKPNVGKSSLINALVGFERAIVFDQPGTTRDVVSAETAFAGWPVELIDTAGIRASNDTLESAGMAKARQALAESDCRLLLLDVSEPLTAEDRELVAELARVQSNGEPSSEFLRIPLRPEDEERDLIASVPSPIFVLHKSDLPAVWEANQIVADGDRALPVSSKTGDGLDELQRRMVETLIPVVPPIDAPIPVSERQIALLKELRRSGFPA